MENNKAHTERYHFKQNGKKKAIVLIKLLEKDVDLIKKIQVDLITEEDWNN